MGGRIGLQGKILIASLIEQGGIFKIMCDAQYS